MGQYFKLVNLDMQEVVCPWSLGGDAKLWEWAANTQGAVLTLLLRKSDEGTTVTTRASARASPHFSQPRQLL